MICSSVNRFFTSNLHRGQTLDQAATQMRGDVATGTWVRDDSKEIAGWSACIRPDLALNASWSSGQVQAPHTSAALLATHAVLGTAAVSEIPLVSQIAGGLDAGVSLVEGDRVGAGLSVAGMVPGAGIAPDVAKLGRLGAKAAAGSRAARGYTAGSRVSMPAWKKIGIDMEEVASGHMKGGSRLQAGNKKDIFPEGMSSTQVERAIRNAYRDGEVLGSQGADRVFVRGPFGNGSIEMWVNKATKEIESAWPKFGD